jgi:hypothetical protein
MRLTRKQFLALPAAVGAGLPVQVTDAEDHIEIVTSAVEAKVRKRGYVSGVAAQSFLDRKTGFRDPGFGLHIVDWLMEPGSDEAYRAQLDKELIYDFNNLFHGRIAKRGVEGPQICTRARELSPRVIRGKDFAAVRMSYRCHIAAPGKNRGSEWTQTLVFPQGKRYFISSDRIVSANHSGALFLRVDMPGHVKHRQGDTFSEIYLSYLGRIPSSGFLESFPPDQKHLYRRAGKVPKRFIRACRLRDPKSGAAGPWLAGMTLAPGVVSEAWCHQRGYVCMIEEFGGRPIKAGESFGAAFIVGYFDSIEEMHRVYDRHRDRTALDVSHDRWKLL